MNITTRKPLKRKESQTKKSVITQHKLNFAKVKSWMSVCLYTRYSYFATQGDCCSKSNKDSVFNQATHTNSVRRNRIRTPIRVRKIILMHMYSITVLRW